MNILIAYATKSGTTKDAAKQLGDYFSAHTVTYADLGNEAPRAEDYDIVIFGSYVRRGKIAKSVSDYIYRNREAILARHFGIFLCCGFCDNALSYFKSNFDEAIWQKADAAMTFGGEARVKDQKGIDKWIMKLMLHSIRANNRNEDRDRDIPLPAMVPENIRRFADDIKRRM